MPGVLYQYLSGDHDRLDALLERAVAKPGVIDMEPYAEFREDSTKPPKLSTVESDLIAASRKKRYVGCVCERQLERNWNLDRDYSILSGLAGVGGANAAGSATSAVAPSCSGCCRSR